MIPASLRALIEVAAEKIAHTAALAPFAIIINAVEIVALAPITPASSPAVVGIIDGRMGA